MSCGSCGSDHDHSEDQKPAEEVTYKCGVCGNHTHEPGECCGQATEKVCGCGSGKMAKECCEAPAAPAAE